MSSDQRRNPLANATPVAVRSGDMLFLVVDVQKQFIESAVHDPAPQLAHIKQFLLMSNVLQIPVIATCEEPIDRKGGLAEAVFPCFSANTNSQCFAKLTYDLCATEEIRMAIIGSRKSQCAVVGAETDVCILQSVLGLRRMGLEVFVVEDCLLSSGTDVGFALKRMYDSGAIPTSWKSLYYELVRTDDFDNSLRDNTQLIEAGYVAPERVQ